MFIDEHGSLFLMLFCLPVVHTVCVTHRSSVHMDYL